MKNSNIFIFILFKLSLSYAFILLFNIFKINTFLLFPLEYIPKKNYKFFNDNNNNLLTPELIMQQIFYKNLITKIEIGTPPITVNIFIKNNDDQFYFASINPSQLSKVPKEDSDFYNFIEQDMYNESLSSSYKKEGCKEVSHMIYHYSEICYAKERLIFNNNNNNLIEKEIYIKLVKNEDENIPGYIGLLYNNSYFQETKSFITLLRGNNLINNYYYFISFDEINPLENKIKAQLIIGGLPHDIFPDKYSIDNYQYTNSYISSFIPAKWRISLDKICLNDNIDNHLITNKLITLSYDIYHIIGTYEIHNIIKNTFMNKLIEENKCFYSNFSQNIHGISNISFYYCKIITKNILYENLNNIKFYSMELDYTFELTKDELFYIKDDYIYLNIIFDENENIYWTLGQIFTTKYSFVFNTDQKQIGFYKNINIKNNNDNNDISNNNYNLQIIICFIVCILFFVCLGIFLGRKIFGWRRKIIANELIEELDYEYKIENNEIKHNVLESKYKSIGNKNKNLFFEMKNKYTE